MFDFDLEAKLYVFFADLLIAEEKKYSACECERSIVYIFHDYNEFKFYFIQNGVFHCDEEINNCILRQTKKGSIIASKKYCDDVIKRFRILNNLEIDRTINNRFDSALVRGL